MNIIKVLEHMTSKDHGWTDKEIQAAVEKIRIHRESRERIATSVLQGLWASNPGGSGAGLVDLAVKQADALIEELKKYE